MHSFKSNVLNFVLKIIVNIFLTDISLIIVAMSA